MTDDDYIAPQDLRSNRPDPTLTRLIEAASPFVAHYEPWFEEHGDESQAPMARVTFGQIRALRAAVQDAQGGN